MTENELLQLSENSRKFYCIKTSTGEKVRAGFWYDDPDHYVFVYAKGSSRYGWKIEKDVFLRDYSPCKVSVAEQWEKRVRKIVSKLTETELWPDVRRFFEHLSQMSYEDLQAVRKIYWAVDREPYDSLKERIQDAMSAFSSKYPFLFSDSGDFDFDFISDKADAKTKSMYFGKYDNAQMKEAIRQAFANKSKLSFRRQVNYDVSFEYDPERNAAWYSEEYRGCGNGHYYLALDSNTALFVEDD